MKKTSVAVVIISAILCFALLTVTAVGYSKHYGDVSTTVLYGASSITTGTEYSNAYEFCIESDQPLNETTIKQTLDILGRRLQYLNVPDYEVYSDHNTKITVRIPYSVLQTYGSSMVSTVISNRGLFEVRIGVSTDADGNPTAETAQSPIVTNTNVKNVNIAESNIITTTTTYQIRVTFDHNGSVSLGSATSQLVNSSSNGGYISYWMDGQMIGYSPVTKPITDGQITIHSSMVDGTTASAYAVFMRSGSLPAVFSLASSGLVVTGNNAITAFEYAVCAGLLILAIFMLLRFRSIGIAPVISLAGSLGALLMVYTGFISTAISTPLNQFTWIGVILLATVFGVFNIKVCSQIEQALKQGAPAGSAIANAFSGSLEYSVRFYIALGATGLLLSVLLNRQNNWITKIFSGLFTVDVYTSLSGLGMLMFTAAIIMILFFNLLERACMMSVASTKAFDGYAAKGEEK